MKFTRYTVILVKDFPGSGPWRRLWRLLRLPYDLAKWIVTGEASFL